MDPNKWDKYSPRVLVEVLHHLIPGLMIFFSFQLKKNEWMALN